MSRCSNGKLALQRQITVHGRLVLAAEEGERCCVSLPSIHGWTVSEWCTKNTAVQQQTRCPLPKNNDSASPSTEELAES